MKTSNVMRALVLGVSRFDFKDKETGKKIRGAKVWYLPAEALEMDNKRGLEPCVINADYSIFEQFLHLPGFYDINFEIFISKGNTSIRFLDANFIQEVSFLGAS